MVIIRTGLITLFSLFIASCSMLSSPFAGVNDDKVDEMTVAETIRTKDLYGAWAIASDDDPKIDFLYVVVLMPNHMGVNYLTLDEKNGQPETEYTESYRWKFNEKEQVFTMHSEHRSTKEGSKPAKEESINETTTYKTVLYQINGQSLAIRFSDSKEQLTFLRMDNSTYQKLVRGVPGLPRLK